jgi:hypothetical protein
VLTEFKIWELTRLTGRLYGEEIFGAELLPTNGSSSRIRFMDRSNPVNIMDLELRQPSGYEELLVMTTGWRPIQMQLIMNGCWYLSRDYRPMSWFTQFPTDVATGFCRFTTEGMTDLPFTSYLVTARRTD